MSNNKGYCGICANCVPQIDGGSGFKNCEEAQAAQIAEDKPGNVRITDRELAEILSGTVDGVLPTTQEIAMAHELQERRKAEANAAWRKFQGMLNPDDPAAPNSMTDEERVEGEVTADEELGCLIGMLGYYAAKPDMAAKQLPHLLAVVADAAEQLQEHRKVKPGVFVPQALNIEDEYQNYEYVAGWNDCRNAVLVRNERTNSND